ncbi:MAG: aldehyde reductase [Nevskiaceae bacterium]|nr:MAG: aldehyde reductase [Nevskiaceae bacterium]TAM28189.1 MAG: aldehyde reductase [Nevskiaceae bacterium]
MQIDKTKPVLVTGGNGYIASWLVKYLLEDGVDVHATVRDPGNQAKVGHLLRAAAGAKGKLTLFKADLLSEGAYDAAMQGCELVFHTASPFVIKGLSDPQKDLVDPAVKGTRNVLEAANRVPSVKRVVLTSSVVSIYGDAVDMSQLGLKTYTEAYWNTTSSVDHQPYNYSKVAAERAAWDIAKAQSRWDLLTINPGLVLGPSLTSASDSTSLSTIRELADGTLMTGVPDMEFGLVDVRDVALAHIKAGYTAAASGRHIAVSTSVTMWQIVQILKTRFGRGYRWPLMVAPKAIVWLIAPLQGYSRRFVSGNVGWPLKFDNSYTRKDLGMQFRPVETTLAEHFQQMLDDGILRKR